MLPEYEHVVQYYETDQMKIVHHSNYIRWFEEARLWFMAQAGISYEKIEEDGVVIPVVEAQASYRSMVRFGDTVLIRPRIEKFNGAVLELSYEVKDKKTGVLRCQGRTRHCFLNPDGKLMLLKHDKPEYHAFFEKMKNEQAS